MFILSIGRSDEFMISFQYVQYWLYPTTNQQPNLHPLHMIMASNCIVSHMLHVEELSKSWPWWCIPHKPLVR